ncbi:MAG TPA: cytochrome c oxidase subunit 4 [Mycobacteriales bacterium]|jgi:hypothetical protein|nr:cytochrome c oxidase subunit 4 [Mycobacteriales bacterium]
MKIESYIFAFVAILLGGSGGVYWFTSHDPAGTALLVFGTALGVLVGSFILLSGRRVGPRPEDNPESEIAEGAGEVGFFSPHSWWPLPTAASAAVICVGIVYGWWLFLVGAVGLLIGVTGIVYEYYVNPEGPYE